MAFFLHIRHLADEFGKEVVECPKDTGAMGGQQRRCDRRECLGGSEGGEEGVEGGNRGWICSFLSGWG